MRASFERNSGQSNEVSLNTHCIKTFTPRSWRRPTRAHSLLEVQTMKTSIEFFLHLVAMARIELVFLRVHGKSSWKRQAKACDRSGQLVVYRTLAKTSKRMAFKNSFYFVTARSFTADGPSTVTDGRCKDNTSKDPFSRCETSLS